jgi:hypothetical protein
MPNFNGSLKAAIAATYSAAGLVNTTGVLVAQDDIGITSGTGSYQADLMYAASRTLAASATDNLDLSGVLTDALGSVLAMAKVVAIYIRARDANTSDLTIGNGANPFVGPFGAAAHTLTVSPGSPQMLTNLKTGWTVTPATGDILKIVNGAAAAATYDIVILGRTA